MSKLCECPAPVALPAIDNFTCAEDLAQIQKLAFQRLNDAAGARNGFISTATPSGNISTKASWDLAISADDGTKIVVTPYLSSPVIEPGAAITFGGGNETPDGIEENNGRQPSTFNGLFRRLPQTIVEQLKKLQCDADNRNLGVYLFDADGSVCCLKETDGYYPIPIRAFFVGDAKMGSFEEPTSNAVMFKFMPNWSDKTVIVSDLDFNPLTDLKNA